MQRNLLPPPPNLPARPRLPGCWSRMHQHTYTLILAVINSRCETAVWLLSRLIPAPTWLSDGKAQRITLISQRGFPDTSRSTLVKTSDRGAFKRRVRWRSCNPKHSLLQRERAATSFVTTCTRSEETAVRTSRVCSVKGRCRSRIRV